MAQDRELLQRYVRDGSAEALDEVVRRHVGLVWSAALREARGDFHLAADLTQATFIVLMRRASSLLSPRVVLSGWLFQVVRYAAADARKKAARQQRREQEAARMYSSITSPQTPNEPDSIWQRASPLLNDAVASLPARDRDLVVLKFFDGKSHAELAQVLGTTENTARQRLFRAMGRLRTFFQRHGIDTTEDVLGATLLRASEHLVPEGLVEKISAGLARGFGNSAGSIAKGAMSMIWWNRIKLPVAAAVAVVIFGATAAVALMQAGPHEAAAAPTTAPAASMPADLSPKQVMIAAWEAAMRGDSSGMNDTFDRLTPDQQTLIKRVANCFGAAQELNNAVAETFGKPAADQLARAMPLGVDALDMHRATETIQGDTAIVDIGRSGPGKIPFVKVDGKWKISSQVLATMNINAVVRTEQMTPIIQNLAADVRAGKYKTPEELQQAMAQMMQAAFPPRRNPNRPPK
ncbi:MAG TPA: sigma-70 family RNA polymerase sigma factor [Tepidisphaeraceae bacterium]|jgi:RNA polymerase sigma factor (sigma-70 family)